MLVVKIELWPFGEESLKKSLGQLAIWNTGGTIESGNYRSAFQKPEEEKINQFPMPMPMNTVEVNHWPRLNRSAWELLKEVLNMFYP